MGPSETLLFEPLAIRPWFHWVNLDGTKIGQFPLTRRVGSRRPRLKSFMATLYFLNKRTKNCLDYWSGRKKYYIKKIILKIKITSTIIGPAMAGPTGPFATALHSHTDIVIDRHRASLGHHRIFIVLSY